MMKRNNINLSEWTVRPGRTDITALHSLYNIKNVRRLFRMNGPNSQLRAGFVVIHNNKILLVKQKTNNINGKIVEGKWSFPKGGTAPVDQSLLDTALRELYEETGLVPKNDQILPTVYVYPRRKHGVNELFAWFICVIKDDIEIHIDETELTDYQWVNMHGFLRGISETNKSTKRLLEELEKCFV